MAAPPNDYDSPWKEALEYYFPDFLALLTPWLHEQIDWSHRPIFLDKELQAIVQHASSKRRYADKLVRLQSKTRLPLWILIHVEIQGGTMSIAGLQTFAERMFQYFYRIGDHYPKNLAASDGTPQQTMLISLGVLTASAGSGTHLLHSQNSLGACSVRFRFPVVHLASWLDRWNELVLQARHNPFAVVVMAQLQAQQTRRSGTQRLASKTQIVRLMYQYKYGRKTLLRVFRLVDRMMALPAELEPGFDQAMVTIEQEHNMAFVTSIERLGEKRGLEKGMALGLEKGREQGLEQGLEKGLREGEAMLLQRLLVRKFGQLPKTLQERLETATPSQLETWSLNILDALSLDDVFGE